MKTENIQEKIENLVAENPEFQAYFEMVARMLGCVCTAALMASSRYRTEESPIPQAMLFDASLYAPSASPLSAAS